jgi:hypothetical protein
MTVPNPESILRHVQFDDFELLMWETGQRRGDTEFIAFKLLHEGAEVLNSNAVGLPGWHPRLGYAIDSDRMVRSVIDWCAVKPGDTDIDYFEKYTEEQIEWVQSHSDELSFWGESAATELVESGEGEPYKFKNLDGWEG